MKKDYRFGVFAAFITAVTWGAMGPLVKVISANGLSQLSVMAYRSVFTVTALGGWLLWKRGAGVFQVSRSLFLKYALLGFLVHVCQASGYMMSCVYLSIPQAVMLHYTFPLLTMLGDYFVIKEKPTAMQVAAGFMILAGLGVAYGLGGQGFGAVSTIGLTWGVISVFGFAGQNIVTRDMAKRGEGSPLLQLFFINAIGGVMIIVGKSIFMGWGDLAVIDAKTFLLMQYPAIVTNMIGFGMLFLAIRYISATTASIICSLEIVMALGFMPVLLHRTPSLYEAAGCAIIMAAVALSILGKRSAGQ